MLFETFKALKHSSLVLVGLAVNWFEIPYNFVSVPFFLFNFMFFQLKNLVLSGFKNIDVIDFDTIDVSNLNRQFLFRPEHIGKSKAEISKQSALLFNPDCIINAYHGNIKDAKFGPSYFKEFSFAINALDNVDARKHVNRMCLAADISLIDAGTAGYLGQVVTIRKGLTECYECQQKTAGKSYAVCTIRSNPSTFVHCIVWAKLLFERLFGKEDDTNAVTVISNSSDDNGSCKCYEDLVFDKVFNQDIQELCRMKEKSLWANGEPISLHLPVAYGLDYAFISGNDHGTWNFQENSLVFQITCNKLKYRREKLGSYLDFDKDDEEALDFVVSAANLRAMNFHIAPKSKFDAKAIAGNIVPAISTTNAIIAGLVIQEAIKLLTVGIGACKVIHCLRKTAMIKKKSCYLYPTSLQVPNPECYVCSSKFITVQLNVALTPLNYFIENVLKKPLSLSQPLISVGNSLLYECGDDIVGQEKEMNDARAKKTMMDLGIKNNQIIVEDFKQDINWTITILHSENLELEDFKILGKTDNTSSETRKKVGTKLNPGNKNQCELKLMNSDKDIVIVNDDDDDIVDGDERSRKKQKTDIEEI